MINDKCRICRRVGQKLFLKGDRCMSPKCAMVKRAYPPGPEGKRKGGSPSEYKKALVEKQKLRKWYGISEHQFKHYVQDILEKRAKFANIAEELIKTLEKRLDNVIFRTGVAKSRAHARQIVNHGFVAINGKTVDIPSYEVEVGQSFSVKENKKKKGTFKEIAVQLKGKDAPAWLEFNKETLSGKIKKDPSLAEVTPPAEISIIFEYYSR